MSDTIGLIISLATGVAAGVIFFGGLWLTVKRIDSMKLPGVAFLFSFVIRTAAVLAAFWWVSQGGLLRIGLCLAGFLLARIVITRTVRSSGEASITEKPESCT